MLTAGRHDQPQLVVGMIVVDAVDDEVHAVAEGVVRLPVEDQPVQPVLGQGPDGHAAQGEQDQRPGRRGRGRRRATSMTTTTGTKTIAGTAGWTREKKSRKRLSNIAGEADRRSVLSCVPIAEILAARWAPSGGGRKARGSRKKAPAKKKRIAEWPCGGFAAVLTWLRAGGQVGATEHSTVREVVLAKRSGWSWLFAWRRPSPDCYFHRNLLCAPAIWTSPAAAPPRPGLVTAPRGSVIGLSRRPAPLDASAPLARGSDAGLRARLSSPASPRGRRGCAVRGNLESARAGEWECG